MNEVKSKRRKHMSHDNTTETTRADLIERLVEDMRYDMEEEVNGYESTLF